MKLGRIGSSADRTDWSGVYSPFDNLEKRKKINQLDGYGWRRNYAYNSPFFHLSRPSITYGDNDSKIYIADSSTTTNGEIRQYNLTTPGDPSTATYSGNSVALDDGNHNNTLDVAFSSDGTRMYIAYYHTTSLFQPPEQYNLSTPWDVSTAVPKVKKLYVAAQEANVYGMYIKPDGTKLYIVGDSGDEINEYDLSTAYDVSTASYNQTFSVSGQETFPKGVEFKPDGTKMYVVGTTGDDINEYNLTTAWDISTASYNQAFSVSAQEISPHSVVFKPDGTKMFVSGSTGDDINEYNLSTAWDVSTASYVQNFATGDSFQIGIAFSDDGTKMYTSGLTLDYIKEWDLSTAWDISTAAINQNSGDIYFNPAEIQLVDDNKLYLVSTNPDQIVGYNLNTAKDIRSIDGILQADDEMSNGQYDYLGGCAISADGTKFYVLDWHIKDRITEFSLPTANELTGATRTGNYISIEPGTREGQPFAMHFSYDGTKIYIGGGQTTRSIYLYNLSTAWDISTATLNMQRMYLYSVPSDDDGNYETMTEAEYYGPGALADIEGLAVTKDGTNILIAHNTNYSEFKLLC